MRKKFITHLPTKKSSLTARICIPEAECRPLVTLRFGEKATLEEDFPLQPSDKSINKDFNLKLLNS
jgi:hypothetical protein